MYELRWNGTRTAALWLAWLALAAALSVSPFRHHLEYFVSPGVLYQRAIIAVLVALPGVVALYVKFRRKGAWRYEPRIAICFALTVCLLYQPRGTAAAAALLASCYAVGRAIRERLSVEKDSAVGRGVAFNDSRTRSLGLGADPARRRGRLSLLGFRRRRRSDFVSPSEVFVGRSPIVKVARATLER